MSGTNWNCPGNNICTRSDALSPGQTYPAIIVTATVAGNAGPTLVNQATVSGGGASSSPTASDPTTIVPAAGGQPGVVSVSPVAGTGSSQTYTFQFSHGSGFQALGVVNVLINKALDGRDACYLAYSVPDNVLYLVSDSGGLLPGIVLNGSGAGASNTQCGIAAAGSMASGSGATLTLTLNMTFAGSFGGNKVVYAAARDAQGNNTGWNVMGVRGVPPLPSTFPIPIAMTPSASTSSSEILTFTYQDAASADNLQTMWALTNTAVDGRSACYVAYYAPGNRVYLTPDNGDGTQATNIDLSGGGTLSNSQCTVSASGSSYTKAGSQSTLKLNITFKSAFAGRKATWLAVTTLNSAATSDWQALGARTVAGN
jgi:hypothetical protein